MIDLAALTKTLPESLRPAVLSAWEIFRQNAAVRSDDELPDHLLQITPGGIGDEPVHCRTLRAPAGTALSTVRQRASCAPTSAQDE